MSASSPPLAASTDRALKGLKQTKNILHINYYSGTVLMHIVISTTQYWLNIPSFHLHLGAYCLVVYHISLPHTVYHILFTAKGFLYCTGFWVECDNQVMHNHDNCTHSLFCLSLDVILYESYVIMHNIYIRMWFRNVIILSSYWALNISSFIYLKGIIIDL